jgi:hypothetical protein
MNGLPAYGKILSARPELRIAGVEIEVWRER